MRQNGAAWIAGAMGLLWASTALGSAASTPPPATPVASPGALEQFEKKVRPLLAKQCLACHSGTNIQGKLDLSTREGLLKGGKSGPALSATDPAASLLLKAVRHQGGLRMPPSGKLSALEIAELEQWVKSGAAWPVGRSAARDPRAHWSYQPLRKPTLPAVKDRAWAKNPVDAFVLARLEKEGLRPSAPASREALLRRVTFDLTGLPPTPEEREAFLADATPDAYARLVDRLLASPRYGERWGRHWLDVVRYSDSNGLDWNEVFPNAWRFRDYVIRSFNQDKPFDQLIREQLAGDLLPAPEGQTEAEKRERLIATGFLVMGPKLLAQQDRKQLALDVIDEQIDATSKAFLGLTVSCARCHDHKFDPIPTKDYYGLAGIFKSTTTLGGTLPRNNRVMYWHERPLTDPATVTTRRTWEASLKKAEDALKKAKEAPEKERLTAEIAALKKQAPPEVPMAMAVQDGTVTDLKVHVRGSYQNLGEPAPRGFVSLLTAATPAAQPLPATTSGRKELADWIADRRNPLTARVIANRVWMHHFGAGLVRTPDNFGVQGELPSHPELLDYLASTLSAPAPEGMGWSLKKLHRLILLSNAYQQSSAPPLPAPNPQSTVRNPQLTDPENRLLWRMNPQRLEAEAVRDAMLQAAGRLDLTAGGTLLTRSVGLAGKEWEVDYQTNRRSVFLPVVRGVVHDLFQVFDFPDPHVVNGRRDVTTVAPQSLYMMNSPFVDEVSRSFATELLRNEGSTPTRVEEAYLRALGRRPTAPELQRAEAYLGDYAARLTGTEADPGKRQLEAWRSFGQALFASAEFRYLR